MKGKKINKDGDYVVKMSQAEINLLHELLGYVSFKGIKHYPLMEKAVKDMLDFTDDNASIVDVYECFKFVKDKTFKDHGSLEVIKDLKTQ